MATISAPPSLCASLCAICKNAPTCIYLDAFQPPLMHCAEFEGAVAAPPETFERANPPLDRSDAAPSAEEESWKHMGLCGTCDHRETCIYPRPEGGVWHCEEYQ